MSEKTKALHLDKKILRFGKELPVSYPSQELVKSLPKDENGNPDASKLPKENVRNIILNCLAGYDPEDKKDIFKVYALGQKISDEKVKEAELTESDIAFLEKVLSDSTQLKDKAGTYKAWAIAPVFELLGLN